MPIPPLDTFLAGYWVGSSFGFIHDLPPDKGPLLNSIGASGLPTPADRARPPHLPAYFRTETPREPKWYEWGDEPPTTITWDQTEGYYIISTLLRLKIEPASGTGSLGPIGTLSGYNWVRRGGHRVADSNVGGSYELYPIGDEIVEGEFTLLLSSPNAPAATPVELRLHWIARNLNEIQWLCLSALKDGAPYRGNIGQGMLARVVY